MSQSFIYLRRFPPFSSIFLFCRLQPTSQEKTYSYVEKLLGEDTHPCPPPTFYIYAWAYRHMCFQHVYILICLLYEVSALEIIVTWDKILIEPNILSFFYSMSYISVCPSTSISQFIASSVHKHLFTAACTLFMSETVFFKASFPCNCSKTITPQNLIEFSGRDLFFIV